jgi:hypothetical protein
MLGKLAVPYGTVKDARTIGTPSRKSVGTTDTLSANDA